MCHDEYSGLCIFVCQRHFVGVFIIHLIIIIIISAQVVKICDVQATIVPFIITDLGSVPLELKSYLEKIGIKPTTSSLMKSALPGTTNIHQKVPSV